MEDNEPRVVARRQIELEQWAEPNLARLEFMFDLDTRLLPKTGEVAAYCTSTFCSVNRTKPFYVEQSWRFNHVEYMRAVRIHHDEHERLRRLANPSPWPDDA